MHLHGSHIPIVLHGERIVKCNREASCEDDFSFCFATAFTCKKFDKEV